MRMTSNWRQIIHGPKIEYCSSLKLGNLFPLYAINAETHFAAFFPNQSLKNVYDSSGLNSSQGAMREPMKINLPNGKYRFTIHFSSKFDPYVLFFRWFVDKNVRLAEDKF